MLENENKEDYAKSFWNRVKTLLKDKGLSQIDLCNNTNILLNTLRVQISRNSQPSISEIVEIAMYLDVSIDFLLTGEERELKNVDLDVDKIRSALLTCLEMLGN